MTSKCWIGSSSTERARISTRQRQILLKICEGKSNSTIARELNITTNTVKYHIKSLFRALNVHNRSMAVRKAFELSWWNG
jgi:DNA-binding NarL/FixJ family response regulator